MKRLLATLLILTASLACADVTTPRLGLVEPTVGTAGWGAKLNSNFGVIDTSACVLGIQNTFTAPQTFGSSVTVNSSMTVTGQISGTTVNISSNSLLGGATFYNGNVQALGTVAAGVWNGTRLTSSYVPTDVAYTDVVQTWTSSQTYNSALGTKFSSFTVVGVVNLSNGVGTSGQVFTSQGAGTAPQWTTGSGGAGGSSGQIQYNNASSLAGLPSTVTASSVTISTPTAIKGSITNDSAVIGYVGEYVTNSVSAQNAGTTGQYSDVTSISLTAGDWDVTGVLACIRGTATFSSTVLFVGISTHSGNDGTGLTTGDTLTMLSYGSAALTFNTVSSTVPAVRMSFSTTTTVYLKGYVDAYTGGPPTHYGRISARRVR